jgi:hypothetical protein
MLRLRLCVLLLSSTLLFGGGTAPASEKEPKGEEVGLRLGYGRPGGGLYESFGAGAYLEFHFFEPWKHRLGVDFRYASLYLGDTHRQDITTSVFGSATTRARLNVNAILVMLRFALVEDSSRFPWSLHLEAGGGLYVVSVLISAGLFQGESPQSHLGLGASASLGYRLGERWRVELTGAAHHLWTSGSFEDWVAVYGEGQRNLSFWVIAPGVSYRLR